MGPQKQSLLEKAIASPNNLRFSDLCKLAEEYGWCLVRQDGTSHMIYHNPNVTEIEGRMMNFQSKRGQAKPYQVRQLLAAIAQIKELTNKDFEK